MPMPVQMTRRGSEHDRPTPESVAGGVACAIAERTMVAAWFGLPASTLDALDDAVIEAMAAHLSGDRHRRDALIAAVVGHGPVLAGDARTG